MYMLYFLNADAGKTLPLKFKEFLTEKEWTSQFNDRLDLQSWRFSPKLIREFLKRGELQKNFDTFLGIKNDSLIFSEHFCFFKTKQSAEISPKILSAIGLVKIPPGFTWRIRTDQYGAETVWKCYYAQSTLIEGLLTIKDIEEVLPYKVI